MACLLIAIAGSAQQKQLPMSESLPGVWNQIYITPNGNRIPTGNYKFLNTDGTFYSMVVWGLNGGNNRPSTIGMYGTYSITSDSTYTEHIKVHGMNPAISNTSSQLKYQLLDKNTLLIKYRNETLNRWIPEIWTRVQLHQAIKKEQEKEI